MSDPGRGPDAPHTDPDEFTEEWADDPGNRTGRWSRFTRNGRPSTPLLAAACVGVLIVLVGIVIGGQREEAPPRPPSNGAGPTTEAPGIDFAPVGDEADVTPTATPSGPASANPTSSPGSTSSPGTTGFPSPGVTPSVTPSRTTQPSRSPAPPAVTYSAVGGYNCTHDATRGFRHVGRFTDGTEGWYSVGSGAWRADGCGGSYDAMPMSGSKTKDDTSTYAEWWFAVGSASQTCAVSTYVPTTSVDRNVAGKPATYQVRDTESGPLRATFTIDQRSNRGSWVAGGTYTVSGGRLVIRIVNRGEDWNSSGPTYEHIAVAQIRVVCR